MADYTTHTIKVYEKDLGLIRSAFISRETEERSLANSYYGTMEYYEHLNNVERLEKIRSQIEEIAKYK
jgi:hypothetical protein